MLKLTKKVELGILAIEVLQAASQPVTSQWLASEFDTTPAFMSQIMARLTKSGIAASTKGPHGGYVLAQQKVTMADVAKSMGERLSFGFEVPPSPVSRLQLAILDVYERTYV